MDNKQLISQYCQQFKMGGIITRIDQLVTEAEASQIGYLDYTARLLGTEAEHRQQNDMKSASSQQGCLVPVTWMHMTTVLITGCKRHVYINSGNLTGSIKSITSYSWVHQAPVKLF